MKGWLDPVGQEPASTYWIRRGVVGVIIIAVVVTISLLATRPNTGRQMATTAVAATPSASASTSATAAPTRPSQSASESADPTAAAEDASVEPETGPTPSEDAEAEQTPTEPAEPAACLSRQLSLRIEGPDTVSVSEPVALTMVASTSQAECILELAEAPATVVISSGNDRIWSTADCPDWQPAETFQLTEGEQVSYTVEWPVRRAAGCELREDVLGAGTYVATAGIGSASGRHVMQLQPAG